MEEKFRRMGLLSDDASDDLLDDNDSGTVVDISQKQYVEGLEWRAEIWSAPISQKSVIFYWSSWQIFVRQNSR